MVFKILKNNKFGLGKKMFSLIKYVFYYNFSSYLFKRKYKEMKNNGLQLNEKVDKRFLKEYKEFWGVFGHKVETKTLEVSYNLSGKLSKYIIPENIFFSDIELTLNNSNNIPFLENKSFYSSWYKESSYFPQSYIHKIEGVIYDGKLNRINRGFLSVICDKLKFPVVLKPNIDSFGGANVCFIDCAEDLLRKIENYENCVVEQKIEQNVLLNNIYSSINTVRVCVYKSVKDNNFYVVNSSLRMGKNGSLDNETSGGIVCNIDGSGKLNSFAVDKNGCKYFEHPNSREKFGFLLPFYEEMCMTAITVCQSIFYANIISLDMCLDKEGQWKVIEVNLKGHTIRFAQYGGNGFFGDFTKEVVKYCLENHWGFKEQKLFS